jgi:hypothetical protein
MKRWAQAIDQNGMPVMNGVPQSDSVSAMVFTGAGSKTQGIPAGANLVLIGVTGGTDFFMSLGASAAVPSADNDFSSTGTSSSEANPLGRWLYGATQITIAVSAACIVTLAYYS